MAKKILLTPEQRAHRVVWCLANGFQLQRVSLQKYFLTHSGSRVRMVSRCLRESLEEKGWISITPQGYVLTTDGAELAKTLTEADFK